MNCSELFAYYRETCAPSIAKLEDFYARNPEYALLPMPGEKTKTRQGDAADAAGATDVGILNKHPEIHNEIRMALTHLSRTALSFDQAAYEKLLREGVSRTPAEYLDLIVSLERAPFSVDASHSIEKAHDHLQRACMDAEKCLYLARMKKAEDIMERYSKYSVEEVGNGDFFETVGRRRLTASEHFESAKIAEAMGDHELAKQRYGLADGEAKELEEYLDENAPLLEEAKEDYLKSPKELIPDIALFAVSLVVAVVAWLLGTFAAGLGGAQ